MTTAQRIDILIYLVENRIISKDQARMLMETQGLTPELETEDAPGSLP